MNHTTAAQRHNARQDKIWERAKQLKTQTRFNASSRHSPLPWSYSAVGGDNFIMAKIGDSRVTVAEAIYDEANGPGISMEELDANKELIVRAVNHADKLAEALRECITEQGAMSERSHYNAKRRLAYITDTARLAIAEYEAAQ